MFQKNKPKALAKIRAAWGKGRAAYVHIASARIYFDHKPEQEQDFQVLNDRIANDLNLDRVFQEIDRTNSKIGQQYLYDRLRRPTNKPAALQAFEEKIVHYQENSQLREEAQLLLMQLNEINDYYYPELIFGELPKKPNWLPWLYLLRGISLGSLLASIFYPVFFLLFLLVIPVNIFLHYRNKNSIGRFTQTFDRFGIFYSVGRALIPFDNDRKTNAHRPHFNNLKSILKKISWVKMDQLQHQETATAAWFLIELIKFITLSEIITFFKAVDQIEKYRSSLHHIFDMIGSIDAAIAVASLRVEWPYWAAPEFTPSGKELLQEDTLHPLLLSGTANKLALYEKSALITGSNMSGKTTFIRTIGINVILAQSILSPICKKYAAPFLRLGTSIQIQDDLEADKSYYLEEVMVIGELVKAAALPEPHLFIIDEMFKGTNTLERVSAAKAVLTHLNQQEHLVLISTHDIELTEYLEDQFELYFFQEEVKDGILRFDYRIKQGKLQHRNAIKILEIMNYPPSIIAEANQLVSHLAKKLH